LRSGDAANAVFAATGCNVRITNTFRGKCPGPDSSVYSWANRLILDLRQRGNLIRIGNAAAAATRQGGIKEAFMRARLVGC
jgi:hypothetical protein